MSLVSDRNISHKGFALRESNRKTSVGFINAIPPGYKRYFLINRIPKLEEKEYCKIVYPGPFAIETSKTKIYESSSPVTSKSLHWGAMFLLPFYVFYSGIQSVKRTLREQKRWPGSDALNLHLSSTGLGLFYTTGPWPPNVFRLTIVVMGY